MGYGSIRELSREIRIKVFVRPDMKYRVRPRIQFVVCLLVCLSLEILRALIEGYPTSALIGQNQLGDTKPLLWQCGCCRVHMCTQTCTEAGFMCTAV